MSHDLPSMAPETGTDNAGLFPRLQPPLPWGLGLSRFNGEVFKAAAEASPQGQGGGHPRTGADGRGFEPVLRTLPGTSQKKGPRNSREPLLELNRGDRIRTCDLVLPKHPRYQAAPRPVCEWIIEGVGSAGLRWMGRPVQRAGPGTEDHGG